MIDSSFIALIEQRPHGSSSLDENFLKTSSPNIFVQFVEKVACTFIKHALITEMIGDISKIDPDYYYSGWTNKNLVHALSREILRTDGREALLNNQAKVITFCRNPYDRFISAYLEKIAAPDDAENEYFKWIRREVLFRKAKIACDEGPVTWADNISLREFAEFVAAQDSIQRDRHWAEQYLLNFADIYQHASLVKIENMKRTLPSVWRKYFQRDFSKKTVFYQNRTNRKKNMLDEKTASIIFSIYEKDFVTFGYDKSSWKKF